MSQKVRYGVAGIALVVGLSVSGIYMMGQAIDESMPSLVSELNQIDGLALKVETTESSFISRNHAITLYVEEQPVFFEQKVNLLPWGARADVRLIQEGETFNDLRRNTTFSNLPLDIHWVANGVFGTASANIHLSETSIKPTNGKDSGLLIISSADLQLDTNRDASILRLSGSWDGFNFKDNTNEIALGKITPDLSFKEIDGFLMTDNASLILEHLSMMTKDYRGAEKQSLALKGMHWSDDTAIENNSVMFSDELSVSELSFKKLGHGVEVANLSVRFELNDLARDAFKALQSMSRHQDDVTTDDFHEVAEKALAKGFGFNISSSADNFVIVDNTNRSGGSIAVAGHVSTAPMDWAQFQTQGFQWLMQKISGQVDIEVGRSLAEMVARENNFPYGQMVYSGYIAEKGDKLVTNITLEDSMLKANGKVLPL